MLDRSLQGLQVAVSFRCQGACDAGADVGGADDVRFRGVVLKDLARRMTPPEITSDGFRTQKIEDFYTAWSPR